MPATPAEWLAPGAKDRELAPVLAHFAEHGWARLGQVLSEVGVAALGARIDELMLGHVRPAGLFYQHDSTSGAYEDLAFGKGWVGPSLAYRRRELDSTTSAPGSRTGLRPGRPHPRRPEVRSTGPC